MWYTHLEPINICKVNYASQIKITRQNLFYKILLALSLLIFVLHGYKFYHGSRYLLTFLLLHSSLYDKKDIFLVLIIEGFEYVIISNQALCLENPMDETL